MAFNDLELDLDFLPPSFSISAFSCDLSALFALGEEDEVMHPEDVMYDNNDMMIPQGIVSQDGLEMENNFIVDQDFLLLPISQESAAIHYENNILLETIEMPSLISASPATVDIQIMTPGSEKPKRENKRKRSQTSYVDDEESEDEDFVCEKPSIKRQRKKKSQDPVYTNDSTSDSDSTGTPASGNRNPDGPRKLSIPNTGCDVHKHHGYSVGDLRNCSVCMKQAKPCNIGGCKCEGRGVYWETDIGRPCLIHQDVFDKVAKRIRVTSLWTLKKRS